MTQHLTQELIDNNGIRFASDMLTELGFYRSHGIPQHWNV